jgi:copper chaperone CopZ
MSRKAKSKLQRYATGCMTTRRSDDVKKTIIISFSILAFMAFVNLPAAVLAGDCTKASTTSSTSCKGEKKLEAGVSKSDCPYMKSAKTAAAEGTEHCKNAGQCKLVQISVDGMTCGGCENVISTALQKVDGVIRVQKVSYEDGVAVLCYDPSKCKTDALSTAITDKGYKAEILQADATVSADDQKKGCAMVDKSACPPTYPHAKKTKAEGSH